MKTGKLRYSYSFTFIVAAMLLLANRSHAFYTNYLDAVSNTLVAVQATLTNGTPQERQQLALIGRALKTLAKPSTSVAGDYTLFVTAATQLGPIVQQPVFLELGTNIFAAFTNEAQAQIVAIGNRIAALSPFVATRKAASNQLTQAQRTLDLIPTLTDFRVAFVVGRKLFTKLTAAARLTAIGEAKPGFALNNVAGSSITHSNRSFTGVVAFTDGTNYTETEPGESPRNGTYTYTRTGLNTAALVLTHDDGSGTPDVTTVKLVFTAAGRGKFTARNTSSGGNESSSGTFTIP